MEILKQVNIIYGRASNKLLIKDIEDIKISRLRKYPLPLAVVSVYLIHFF